MNDETRKLEEMLERATAPGDQMPGDLDAETSSLREGWLALSKLLEDAQVGSEQPLNRWQVTLRPSPRRWRLAVAVVVGWKSAMTARGAGTACLPCHRTSPKRQQHDRQAPPWRAPVGPWSDGSPGPPAPI